MKFKKFKTWSASHMADLIMGSSFCALGGTLLTIGNYRGIGIILFLLGFLILLIGAKN